MSGTGPLTAEEDAQLSALLARAVDDSLGCWVRMRLHGVSASMSGAEYANGALVRAFDRVRAAIEAA
jgi:hypothetical protein